MGDNYVLAEVDEQLVNQIDPIARTRVYFAICDLARHGSEVTKDDIRKHPFIKDLANSSYNRALRKLCRRGVVENTGHGIYRLVENAMPINNLDNY